MRIVFIGAVEFSRHCLEAVIKANGNVVAVITIAKHLANTHSDYVDLSRTAINHGIPIHQVIDVNSDDNVELIKSLLPDIIFVFGWSRLISKPILDTPSMGCIGSHPALLPKNRGRHPIVWTLVEGLKESGLTFFYLEDTADSGDILWQRSFPVTLQDDAQSLYTKINILAGDAVAEFLPQLEQRQAPRISQDHTQATEWRKRNKKDGEINWSTTSMTVFNLVRALTHPYVGAHTIFRGSELKIWKADLPRRISGIVFNRETLPGTVLATTEHGFTVKTGDSYILVDWAAIECNKEIEVGAKFG